MTQLTSEQMLLAFSREVEKKLDYTFRNLIFSGLETSGQVITRAIQAGAKQAFAGAIDNGKLYVPEKMYVLPSGDAIRLSRLTSVKAFSSSVVVGTLSSGLGVSEGLTSIDAKNLEDAVSIRDQILKDHDEFMKGFKK
jgi:hypothetical protein